MFLQVSVCPRGVCPVARWDTHPLGRHPPPAIAADGMHPTGMHSCICVGDCVREVTAK